MKYYWTAKNNNSYLNGCRCATTLLGAVRAARAYVRGELHGDGIIYIYATDPATSEPIRMDERSIFTGHKWRTRGEQTMTKSRFKTKAGLLTPYALSCGYMEKYERNNIQITLEWDSCSYAVRSYDFNTHNRIAWDNYDTLTDARKRYTELKRGIK